MILYFYINFVVVDAGTPVNTCRPSPGDKWSYLHDKYPNVSNRLSKLKDYQLKLHIDASVQPVIQSNHSVSFSHISYNQC